MRVFVVESQNQVVVIGKYVNLFSFILLSYEDYENEKTFSFILQQMEEKMKKAAVKEYAKILNC